MKVDILYCAHNRRAFTEDSLAMLERNTNWSLVQTLWLYDDASTDGTRDVICDFLHRVPVDRHGLAAGTYGGPVTVMNDYLHSCEVPAFAKIDNDVMVPSGWLDACVSVMEGAPELDLLGIEPPMSRTPAPWAMGQPVARPEFDVASQRNGYARCESIGGIGLMRARAFHGRRKMQPFKTYGGFTNWQTENRDLIKGWITPPLNVFLLDRLPMEPYLSLSKHYMAQGWQRPWTNYSFADSALWDWWQGVLA